MIEASVSLKSENSPSVGRERFRLLQAVARTGSISAGAREVGLSYKAAWDALEAMANLFGSPLLSTRSGGAAGGGSELTATGVKVIESYARMEAEMARVVRMLEPELAGSGVSPLNLMSGFLMRTSARNALRGVVDHVASDKLNAEVGLRVSEATTIWASVTNRSLNDLGLCVGREAIALIKAPFVMIAPGDAQVRTSARNCIAGTVMRLEVSGIGAEIVIDIGGGKTLAAHVSAQSVQSLGIAEQSPVQAMFDASHVILAID